MTQFKVLELCLKYPEVVDLLNEQDERIRELEQENKRLKQGKYIYGIHGGSNDRK